MVYVSTRAGKRHRNRISEDAVLVGSEILSDLAGVFPMPDTGFICVADGVGGNRGGAQASSYVLNALAKWNALSDADLKTFLIKINNNLLAAASADGSADDMATTLTGLCAVDGGFRLVHIGNTRAYIRQGKYLKQITSDHTTYHWLISSGQSGAAEKCNKSEITNCFGGKDPALLSKLYIADCPPFSLALLTSDGVHDYLDLDTLEDVISGEGSYEGKCDEIIRRAQAAGSEDDLSVVMICPSEMRKDR